MCWILAVFDLISSQHIIFHVVIKVNIDRSSSDPRYVGTEETMHTYQLYYVMSCYVLSQLLGNLNWTTVRVNKAHWSLPKLCLSIFAIGLHASYMHHWAVLPQWEDITWVMYLFIGDRFRLSEASQVCVFRLWMGCSCSIFIMALKLWETDDSQIHDKFCKNVWKLNTSS
mgnify:FL=1